MAALRFVPGVRKTGTSHRILLAARGSAWTAAGYGGSQLLRLATQLTLARLVSPSAFGLVALVMVFLSGLDMLSDLGIGLDVVQHPDGDDPRFINTAFLIQAIRGLILFSAAAALAYPFALFYHQPAVRALIFVASASVALRGLAGGSIWTMTRHVQLHKLTALNLIGDASGLVVSVVWALLSPTAWALVVGRVVSSAVYMLGSHIIGEQRMSLEWDSKAARDILIFGTGMFLSSATYFLSGEAERLVVGKFVSVAELGCFSLALALSAAPFRGIQQIVSQVFFPMIAKAAREDRSAAARDFRKARLLVLAVGIVVGCGFILGGHLIVHVLLGPRYAETGWMLQLLGFRAALDLFSAIAGSMLFAIGVSKYAAVANVSKLVFLAVGLSIAFGKFGFREAVWVLALSQLANHVVQIVGLRRHFKSAATIEIYCTALFLATAIGSGFLSKALQ